MKKMAPPTFTVEEVIRLCSASIRSKPGLAQRLRDAIAEFRNRETEYQAAAQHARLFDIQEELAFGAINGDEMSDLYEKTFVRSVGTRPIYDALQQAAPGRICPLCNQRTVRTLDHHLSKAHHPALAVTPFNLVPACRECNEDTGTRRPSTVGEQTLHPYFDNVAEHIWLKASFDIHPNAAVRYSASPPAVWSAEKCAIVSKHFEIFKLGVLYTVHAAVEISNIKQELIGIHAAGGWTSVAAEMAVRANSRRRPTLNSWQGAFYQAASESQWFCDEGFLEFLEQ